MNKKKVLKIVLFVVLLLIILFAIHTIRNFIIITNLQNNLKPYLSSTNYHLKTISTEMTVNYYKKDGKQVVIQERNKDGAVSKISMYDNGEKIMSYYDTPTDKIVKENTPSMISVNIVSYFEGMCDSTKQTIYMSAMLKIKNVEHKGKSCYSISPLFSNETNIEYIEKDTGLTIKSSMLEETVEKEYEFNNVSDDIFVEPDISQYKLVEDN